MRDWIDRTLSRLEWRWSLLSHVAWLVSSFALPAWALQAADLFSEYAPFSWVAAGFAGLLLGGLVLSLFAWSYGKWVRSKYDRSLYERTGFVDPMAATFENKRIFLADFCLPSDPHIEGRTFINCEIVGPTNLYLRKGNNITEQKLPIVDAVVLNVDKRFFNGVIVDNCTFRRCAFKRTTIMMLPAEYEAYSRLEWLNWISTPDEPELQLAGGPNQPEGPALPPPQDTPAETQR